MLNLINYWIRVLIIVMWVYLIYNESITLNRIITFIIIFLIIYFYSRFAIVFKYILLNETVIKYVKNHSIIFRKIVYVLLEIHRWINPFLVFLIYTDKCLYKINRYITSTKYIHYNFVVYVILKYYLMFGLIKLIVYQYYNFWYKLVTLTIIEILFKRMYGLILSVLIFTDLLNNLISYLSHYNIFIYIFIYYIISMLCVIWEILYFYYVWLNIINKKIAYIIYLFDKNFSIYTKLNTAIFLRSQFTWLGRVITDLLDILVPDVDSKNASNFKEDFISLTKVGESSYFMSGRIAYYIPLKNRISFKYFDYFGGVMDFGVFETTFELYWKIFKSILSYNNFFKPISEIKGKPSIFLYKNIQDLLKLYDVHNQPINRLMNWMYFEIKSKEYSNLLNESDTLIVKQNLLYFKKVDELRAKLMYFIIWDIEYFYNENKDYNWNCWIIQFHSILDKLIFKMDDRFSLHLLSTNLNKFYKLIFNKKGILKFYDPEENMEYLNRLFNVLGIADIVYNENSNSNDIKYYVSDKFNNYNEKYVELLKIMYTHDFKRWEEKMCVCSYLSSYEVEIAYKIEDFMLNLRKEWLEGLQVEKLEERNWRLLKELEELM